SLRYALPRGRSVAQVSKPAVSQTSKSADRTQPKQSPNREALAVLETCDTADLEVCATPLPRGSSVAQVSKPAVSQTSKSTDCTQPKQSTNREALAGLQPDTPHL